MNFFQYILKLFTVFNGAVEIVNDISVRFNSSPFPPTRLPSLAAHQMGHKEQYRQTTNALCPVSFKEVEIGIITKMCTFPLIFDYFR